MAYADLPALAADQQPETELKGVRDGRIRTVLLATDLTPVSETARQGDRHGRVARARACWWSMSSTWASAARCRHWPDRASTSSAVARSPLLAIIDRAPDARHRGDVPALDRRAWPASLPRLRPRARIVIVGTRPRPSRPFLPGERLDYVVYPGCPVMVAALAADGRRGVAVCARSLTHGHTRSQTCSGAFA
jgi:hypothetical protein